MEIFRYVYKKHGGYVEVKDVNKNIENNENIKLYKLLNIPLGFPEKLDEELQKFNKGYIIRPCNAAEIKRGEVIMPESESC